MSEKDTQTLEQRLDCIVKIQEKNAKQIAAIIGSRAAHQKCTEAQDENPGFGLGQETLDRFIDSCIYCTGDFLHYEGKDDIRFLCQKWLRQFEGREDLWINNSEAALLYQRLEQRFGERIRDGGTRAIRGRVRTCYLGIQLWI